ncbi:MAG: hypothetical protein ACD_48C00144G0001 [uncultured bacterium]|nr:MAG: hypothetical protein ACD_48C00144G0001 [uncultured bacterium]
MKKKVVRRKQAARPVRRSEKKNFLLLLKSWMFVVMVALMLGIGAIVGSFISTQMNATTPQVAGVSIEVE